jgi:hypothetical protein
MSDVFYTPPTADLQTRDKENPEFFTVAPNKLIVMMLLTHGLYVGYWLYKNWKMYGVSSGRSIWPLARTILSIIYIPSLFSKIDRACKANDGPGLSYWAVSAAIYIFLPFLPLLTGIGAGMQNALAVNEYVPSIFWIDLLAGTVIFIIQVLIVLRVQRFINRLNGDPDGMANNQYSIANGFWIVIGLLVWLWITVGMYLMTHA